MAINYGKGKNDLDYDMVALAVAGEERKEETQLVF